METSTEFDFPPAECDLASLLLLLGFPPSIFMNSVFITVFLAGFFFFCLFFFPPIFTLCKSGCLTLWCVSFEEEEEKQIITPPVLFLLCGAEL